MGPFIAIFSLLMSVAGIFWSPALWIVLAVWACVWIFTSSFEKLRYSESQSVFNENDVLVLQKYQAFFKMPFTAIGLGNAAAPMQLLSFVMICILLFQHRWIESVLMLICFFGCSQLRYRLSPLFMLREAKALHLKANDLAGFQAARAELAQVSSVLSKVNEYAAEKLLIQGDFGVSDDLLWTANRFVGHK